MQAHVFISGQVQGVGYRRFVKRRGQNLGLTGWVRNLPDRRVEAMFSGKKEHIEEMLKICKKGPFLADVTHIDVVWGDESQRYQAFDIFV